eukprot:GHVQ01014545.1.p1 GENE.GHVQ01014545.1~~GHVQ01014545.1.p1  ORF type:complete len:292 (+),score=44.26 GHVQ01014545.1:154-1029(+)
MKTLSELLESAMKYSTCIPPRYDDAIQLCKQALMTSPDNLVVLSRYAQLLSDCGQVDAATEILRKFYEQPQTADDDLIDKRFPQGIEELHEGLSIESKLINYFYFGQLTIGDEAKDSYSRGIDMLNRYISLNHISSKNSPYYDDMRKMICRSACSIAEVYMTDLCDTPDAETESLRHIQMALDYDPNNIEALSTLAVYKKTIGKLDEAWDAASRCLASVEDIEEDVPSVELRTNLAMTLIDLKKTDEAISILDGCLITDDKDVNKQLLPIPPSTTSTTNTSTSYGYNKYTR